MTIYAEDLPPNLQQKIGVKSGRKSNKPSKYHNKTASRGNVSFPSQHEAARYDELMLLLKAGEIKDLKLQEEFVLQRGYITPQGEKIRPIAYRADFTYYDRAGEFIVEDAKGVRTEQYKQKKKLLQGVYNITIREV